MDFDSLAKEQSDRVFQVWIQNLLRNSPEALAGKLEFGWQSEFRERMSENELFVDDERGIEFSPTTKRSVSFLCESWYARPRAPNLPISCKQALRDVDQLD